MASYRRTRIICTLGPACDNDETLQGLLAAGMDVARLNFSHKRSRTMPGALARLRAHKLPRRRRLATLLDLQGPKIRVAGLGAEGWTLRTGDRLTVAGRGATDPNKGRLAVNHEAIVDDLAVGQRILLDDGRLALTVLAKASDALEVEVKVGGWLQPRKGVNVPEAFLSLPALTEKDREDLRFAVEAEVDYIALSFVQRPEDIEDLRQALAALGATIPIIAKIEKPQAGGRPPSDPCDGGRHHGGPGDLGVGLPAEQVPLIQKTIIRAARAAGLPVITATQMLESMVDSPTPNPRRSLGCSQRRAGRHGRGDALGGNGKRCLPNLNGRNHGPHRPARRGGPASRVARPGERPAVRRRRSRCRGGCLPPRRTIGRQGNLLPQQQRCHPAPTVPPSTPDAAHRPHRYRGDPPPFGAALGCARLPTEPAMARDIEGAMRESWSGLGTKVFWRRGIRWW